MGSARWSLCPAEEREGKKTEQRLSHELSISGVRRQLWLRQSKLHPLQRSYATPEGDPQPGWQGDSTLPIIVTYLCPGDSRGGHTSGIALQGDRHSLGGSDKNRAKLNAGGN